MENNKYDSRDNYVVAHLIWIADHKTFIPQEQQIYTEGYSYLEVMTQLYQNCQNSPYCNSFAFVSYIRDKTWYNKKYSIEQTINNAVANLRSEPTVKDWWFVTIGFNHETWSVSDCCKAIMNILDFDWIVQAKANFELFRKNGEHPHCHILLKAQPIGKKKVTKSIIVEKIFKPKYVQKIVKVNTFIDVKPMGEHHLDYINLIKEASKMPYVEKDIQWRLSAGIPDFEKNFDLAKFDV